LLLGYVILLIILEKATVMLGMQIEDNPLLKVDRKGTVVKELKENQIHTDVSQK